MNTPADNPSLVPQPGHLYVVATPIGNLADLTDRARAILGAVDVVACEDTRTTGTMLTRLGLHRELTAYHDHNEAEVADRLAEQISLGKSVAVVSDAGTPLISDPGYKLVREAAELGIPIYAIPGASAPLTALASSGLPTDRFTFAGFPPPKSSARKRFLTEMKSGQGTLIFFEGPSRLVASLTDMAEVFGAREAAVARELTKKFEETRRGFLPDLAAHYAEAGPPRGEIVILVGPPGEQGPPEADAIDAAILAADDSRPLKEIAAEIAEALGLKRRDVYERALELRDKGNDEEEA